VNPRDSVIAHYVGGPLDNTREPVSLIDGRPPWERRCAEPLPPIGPADLAVDGLTGGPRVGVYYWKGGTQARDFEGFPGDKRWVEATYEWKGWQ
jgi:hypothetical protein